MLRASGSDDGQSSAEAKDGKLVAFSAATQGDVGCPLGLLLDAKIRHRWPELL